MSQAEYSGRHYRLAWRTMSCRFGEVVLPSSLLTSLVVLSLLVSHASTDLIGDCLRWNCPCAGDTLRPDTKATPTKRFQQLSRKAEHTRQSTHFLLNRVHNERFRGNQDHSTALRECTNLREQSCVESYLEQECLLEGLPIIESPDGETIDVNEQNADDIFQNVRSQLASLAVFIEQARLDERRHVSDQRISFHDDLLRLEEEGLYNILCGLQVNFSQRRMPWHPPLPRDVMREECRMLRNRAAIDNRNYMVLYTLERLLRTIVNQFQSLANHRAKRHLTAIHLNPN